MGKLEYKDHKVLASLFEKAWHPKLIEVLVWMVFRYWVMIFTQGYEERDYSSTHSTDPLRAFDIRSGSFDDPQKIVDDINSHWIYDPSRPEFKVAILHNVGSGMHIHIQVHENTCSREVEDEAA